LFSTISRAGLQTLHQLLFASQVDVRPLRQTFLEASRARINRSPARGLKRRTSRGGRDSIDHAPGGHDDLANSVAGVADVISSGRGGHNLDALAN
jgi:hypothetical protein